MNFLKKAYRFIRAVAGGVRENRLTELAGALTYRLVFACVPFLIFLMTLVGSLNIDPDLAESAIAGVMPEAVAGAIRLFIVEMTRRSGSGLLSVSLLVAVYSAGNGFLAVIRGVNAAYGQQETRGFIKVRLVAAALVIVLAFSIVTTLLLFIFGDRLYDALLPFFGGTAVFRALSGFAGSAVAMAVLLAALMTIYRIAACGKQPFRDLLPGAAGVLAFWMLTSKGFNWYVNNFSRFSSLYGGVAGVFVLMLWLNLIANAILIGAQINALLSKRDVV